MDPHELARQYTHEEARHQHNLSLGQSDGKVVSTVPRSNALRCRLKVGTDGELRSCFTWDSSLFVFIENSEDNRLDMLPMPLSLHQEGVLAVSLPKSCNI